MQVENFTEIRSLSLWTETRSLRSHTSHYPFCAKNTTGTVWDNKKTISPLRKPKTQQMTYSGGLLGVQLCALVESLQFTRNKLKSLKGRGSQSLDLLDNFALAQIKSSNQELLYSKSLQAVESSSFCSKLPWPCKGATSCLQQSVPMDIIHHI